jgi:hypothetical protein
MLPEEQEDNGMPGEDQEIEKIKGKIRKQFEDRAEVADKFMSDSDGKESLNDVARYLENFYGIKLKVTEENPNDPFRPAVIE